MDKLTLVQKIGDVVCEGCEPGVGCEIPEHECERIRNALDLLDSFLRTYKPKKARR